MSPETRYSKILHVSLLLLTPQGKHQGQFFRLRHSLYPSRTRHYTSKSKILQAHKQQIKLRIIAHRSAGSQSLMINTLGFSGLLPCVVWYEGHLLLERKKCFHLWSWSWRHCVPSKRWLTTYKLSQPRKGIWPSTPPAQVRKQRTGCAW